MTNIKPYLHLMSNIFLAALIFGYFLELISFQSAVIFILFIIAHLIMVVDE